jgi:ABC-type phosphate/phosphonate transport system permease subunit
MRMSGALNAKEGHHLKLKTKTMQERLHISIAITLIVGLSVSVWIYVTAEAPVENDLISDYENSKMYMRSLKVYGGQFSVLADEIRRWFITLWQGKNLAYTVASITAIVALVLYVVASDPSFKASSEEGDMK